MIEMRWVKEKIPASSSWDSPPAETDKVLQYRYQFKAPKNKPKLLEHVWEVKWSDWIDVPTVTES